MAMTERAKSIAVPEPGSAKKVLFELQVEQHNHDEIYHREIARLSLHHRLNHMALHFAKYVGKLASAADSKAMLPTYVDTLVIALSTSNVLNLELSELLEVGEQEYPGLLALGRALAHRMQPELENRNSLIDAVAIAAGRIAAACEKIDHLEEISFRAEASASIARLSALSIAFISRAGIDPAQAVRTRLEHVKERLKLHGRV